MHLPLLAYEVHKFINVPFGAIGKFRLILFYNQYVQRCLRSDRNTQSTSLEKFYAYYAGQIGLSLSLFLHLPLLNDLRVFGRDVTLGMTS